MHKKRGSWLSVYSPVVEMVSKNHMNRGRALRIAIGTLLVFLVLMAVQNAAADYFSITDIGKLGGSTYAAEVSGNYAYISQGSDLVVLDISIKNPPVEVSRIETFSIIRDIALAGNYAYVTLGEDGLAIFDVSHPESQPYPRGSYNTDGYSNGVAVRGNYAYVADSDNGLVIINVSDPDAPTFAGSNNTAGNSMGVAVEGNYAYVADSFNGLVIFDISDPETPTYAGGFDNAGISLGVAVEGNYVYMADSWDGLAIIDINNPNAPALKGGLTAVGNSYGVSVEGNYAYIAAHDSGLSIVDVSTPEAPALIGSYDGTRNSYGVSVAENYAYVADGGQGLVIVNVSDPAVPTWAGSYRFGTGLSVGVAVDGNYAYVADAYNGLAIVDSTNPGAPVIKGSYYFPAGYSTGVAVTGNYAYLENSVIGLKIINISDPAWLTDVGDFNGVGYSYGMAVAGNYAYVAAGNSGLVILDMSDPEAPTVAGSNNAGGDSYGVAVAGDYAYMANAYEGLVILNVSDPEAPTVVGNFNLITPGADTRGVAVEGNFAYLAYGLYGLVILNVSDPEAPAFAGSYDTAGYSYGVTVSGNYAYVADGSSGLVIVDVSDPEAPTFAGNSNTAGESMGVAVSGNHAFLADMDNGLVIFQIDIPRVHNINKDTHYFKIQSAIDDADDGDEIHVDRGNYNENIMMNKPLILIGENKTNTIISGTGIGDVIRIDADNSIFKGFTVKGSGDEWYDAGISVAEYKADIRIEDNLITDNERGFSCGYCSVTIENNTFISNRNDAIYLVNNDGIDVSPAPSIIRNNQISGNLNGIVVYPNTGDIITDNTVSGNTENGMTFLSGGAAVIESNTVNGNSGDGILFDMSTWNTLRNNEIFENLNIGITIDRDSNNNHLIDNIIHDNINYGIYIQSSSIDNNISSNKIFNNNEGIVSYDSSDNQINNNLLENNIINAIRLDSSQNFGIYTNFMNGSNNGISFQSNIEESSNNLIYNNYFNNTNNVNFEAVYQNTWNATSYQAGPNIAGGPYIAGNFWAAPDSAGFSQMCDSDADGICTDNNTLNELNIDYLPLAATVTSTTGPVHNINKNKNYTTIQGAINAATPGDEIHVDSGTYYENVNVTKQLTLRGIGMPVVDAGGSGSVITLSADGIVLEGFIATGNGNYLEAGIKVISNNNTLIDNNATLNNWYGIFLKYSSDNELSGNNVSNNNYIGIYLDMSSNNKLSSNNASNNSKGIILSSSSNNTIIGNNASSNIDFGIFLDSSSNNMLIVNNASNNLYGISLLSSSNNNTLRGNNASNNSDGIFLGSSSNNNTLNDNNASSNDNLGIYLQSSSNNTLRSNNVLNNNYNGILLVSSSNNNTLNDNNASSNDNTGIYLQSSNNNMLGSNNASNNPSGIYLDDSSNNTINGNNALNNEIDGIFLISSSNNTLDGNNASNNSNGIILSSSSNNTLRSNNASNNNDGIFLSSSRNNNLSGNNASNNYYGIALVDYSNTNILSGNNASSNKWRGIYLDNSSSNIIYNNIFKNTNNVRFDGSNVNSWNTTLQSGINIIGGPNLGGNFWAHPNGTGVSLECSVGGKGEGICNNPYTLDSSNIDYLPLTSNVPAPEYIPSVPVNLQNSTGNFWVNHSWSANSSGNVTDSYNVSVNNTWHNGTAAYFNNTAVGPQGWSNITVWAYNNSGSGSISLTSIGQDTQSPAIDRVHNMNTGKNYTTIQAAINEAIEGDEIHVDSGTYNENVNVNKRLILRGIGMPVVDASGSGSAITLAADGIVLEGFAATGVYSPPGGYFEAGIKVTSNNNTLSDNNASNNSLGIYLDSSSNNTLSDNNASNNYYYGINLIYSNNNTLRGNNASNNSYWGILLQSSNNNTLKANIAEGGYYGISLQFSSNSILTHNIMTGNNQNFRIVGMLDSYFINVIDTTNTVDGKPIYYITGDSGTSYDIGTNAGWFGCINCINITVKDLTFMNNSPGILFWNTSNSEIQNVTIANNLWGIWFGNSNNNNITGSVIRNNPQYGVYMQNSINNTFDDDDIIFNCGGNAGIYLGYSDSNTFRNSNISNNTGYGIMMGYSSYNKFYRNTIINNALYGIYIYYNSNNNKIYNNILNNTNNVQIYGLNLNTWNTTMDSGINIIGGPNLAGNFWAHPNGTGFSIGCGDSNGDGICNDPYTLNSDNIDYLPLTARVSAPGYNPPAPINLQNTTGNFWVNHTWQANPSGNVTDSFNVSVNNAWHNGTATYFNNTAVGPQGWSNITIWAYNNSGSGRMSLTSILQNTQAPAMPSPTNQIRNPGFESGTTDWNNYGVSFTTSPPANEGLKSANIGISTVSSNMQLYQYEITLEPYTRYRLTFAAFSNTGHDMSVKLFKHGSPYTNYGLDPNYDLTTVWQEFSTDFTTTGFSSTVNDGRLMFQLGSFGVSGDKYYIDNVRLEKVSPILLPPTITTHPAGQTVAIGQTATFSVVAAGSAPLNYQWRRNGSEIPGATGPSYTTLATTMSDNGAEFCVNVSNLQGIISSNKAVLTIVPPGPPSITTQPLNQTVNVGQTATFSVVATGTAPLTYQWQKNGSDIPGAMGASYMTPTVTLLDNHSTYRVNVTNPGGSIMSIDATLTVNPETTINLIMNSGFESGTTPWLFYTNGGGTFSRTSPGFGGSGNAAKVVLSSIGSIMQFYQDGITLKANTRYSLSFEAYSITGHDVKVNLMGIPYADYGLSQIFYLGTNWQSFTTEFTTKGFAGTVSNGRLQFWFVGFATAGDIYYIDDIRLEEVSSTPVPPGITTHPSSQTVNEGQNATFSVVATGSAPLTYQWQKNGTNISGATGSSHITPATTMSDNGALFGVIVSNPAGSVTSDQATCTVVIPSPTAPGITTHPSSQTVNAGQNATFSVVATGSAPLTYQWQKNGTNISGATGASYTTPPATISDSSSTYRVNVTNSVGSVTSNAATLTVTTSINLIKNPGFESGTTPWLFYTNGGGSFSRTSPGFGGSGNASKVVLSSIGSIMQFYQDGITLNANTRYRLSFAAYSNTGHDVKVNLMGIPYADYGLSQIFNLGTNWQSFTTEFTTKGFAGTVSNGRLQFWFEGFAAAGDTYYIDDVKLEEVLI